jgi:hypothetical protein
MSSAGGMRGVSGCGGGAPEKTWRQTAAPKEKALQELLGANAAGQCCQAGSDPGGVCALGGKNGSIGGQPGPSIGAVLL